MDIEEQTAYADSTEQETDVNDEIDQESDDDEFEDDQTDGDEESLEDQLEDVDYEGKQYKLPKELKEALLRQADYTRKTQEIADVRRALQAQATEIQEQSLYAQAVREDMAHMANLDNVLSQYSQVDWQKLATDDPAEAQRHWIQYQQAKEQRAEIEAMIGQKTQMLHSRVGQAREQQLAVGIQQLSAEIPNFVETRKELLSYGINAGGFTPEEMTSVTDPRHVRILHKAYLYDKMMAGKKGSPKGPAQPQAPVTTIKGKSGGSSQVDLVKDASRLSADEWARRRNAQIAKRNKR